MPTATTTITEIQKTATVPEGGEAGEAPFRTAASAPSRARIATAAVVGASGYTGALLAELLLHHPSIALTHLSSEALAGLPVAAHLPRLRTAPGVLPGGGGRRRRRGDRLRAAWRGSAGGQAAARSRGQGRRPLRRLPPRDRRHTPSLVRRAPIPDLLAAAVYGLTELHRDEVAGARLVANPGCYPTAAVLGLAPLKRLGLLDVVIDAKSGVSGAGKTPKETTHFCAVDSDLVAYGVQAHRHYPEIAAGLARAAAAGGPAAGAFGAAVAPAAPPLTFVPHLVPLQRGIVETIYVRPATFPLPSAERVRGLFEETYAGEHVRQGLRGAAPAQGRDGDQLLPAPRPRSTGACPGSSSSAYRQPHEGRLGTGGPEHEPDVGAARDRGAPVSERVRRRDSPDGEAPLMLARDGLLPAPGGRLRGRAQRQRLPPGVRRHRRGLRREEAGQADLGILRSLRGERVGGYVHRQRLPRLRRCA